MLFQCQSKVVATVVTLLSDYCIIYDIVEEFEDIKGVIRIRKSKNRQHNGQIKVQKDKQRSTKHTHKTNDRVTRTPLKTGGELRCCGRVGSSGTCSRLVYA